MSVCYEDDAVTVHHGDCIEVLRGLPSGSVDSIVTDPPYGIRFMGQTWDGADIARRTQQGLDSSKGAPDGARGPHGGLVDAGVFPDDDHTHVVGPHHVHMPPDPMLSRGCHRIVFEIRELDS